MFVRVSKLQTQREQIERRIVADSACERARESDGRGERDKKQGNVRDRPCIQRARGVDSVLKSATERDRTSERERERVREKDQTRDIVLKVTRNR